METKNQSTASRNQRPPAPAAEVSRPAPTEAETGVQLLLISFRSGEAVERHPDVQPWVTNGWAVRSAVPRIVESGATKVLVVLERDAGAVDLTDSKNSAGADRSPRASA